MAINNIPFGTYRLPPWREGVGKLASLAHSGKVEKWLNWLIGPACLARKIESPRSRRAFAYSDVNTGLADSNLFNGTFNPNNSGDSSITDHLNEHGYELRFRASPSAVLKLDDSASLGNAK